MYTVAGAEAKRKFLSPGQRKEKEENLSQRKKRHRVHGSGQRGSNEGLTGGGKSVHKLGGGVELSAGDFERAAARQEHHANFLEFAAQVSREPEVMVERSNQFRMRRTELFGTGKDRIHFGDEKRKLTHCIGVKVGLSGKGAARLFEKLKQRFIDGTQFLQCDDRHQALQPPRLADES